MKDSGLLLVVVLLFFLMSSRTPAYAPPPGYPAPGPTTPPPPQYQANPTAAVASAPVLRGIENTVNYGGLNVGAIAGKVGDAASNVPTWTKVVLPGVALVGITQGFINNPKKEAGNVAHGIGTAASDVGHAVAKAWSWL
jgi:hypothetical protein